MSCVVITLLWSSWSGSVTEARLAEKYVKGMEEVSGTGYHDLESGVFARSLLFFPLSADS